MYLNVARNYSRMSSRCNFIGILIFNPETVVFSCFCLTFVALFEKNDTVRLVCHDDYGFWIVKDIEGSDNGIFLEGLKKITKHWTGLLTYCASFMLGISHIWNRSVDHCSVACCTLSSCRFKHYIIVIIIMMYTSSVWAVMQQSLEYN